jgi:hypothetical protein
MNFVQALAAMQRWLHQSDAENGGYRITINVPTVGDEARLRLALKNELENVGPSQLDLDKPFRLMGFGVEFKWPSGNGK